MESSEAMDSEPAKTAEDMIAERRAQEEYEDSLLNEDLSDPLDGEGNNDEVSESRDVLDEDSLLKDLDDEHSTAETTTVSNGHNGESNAVSSTSRVFPNGLDSENVETLPTLINEQCTTGGHNTSTESATSSSSVTDCAAVSRDQPHSPTGEPSRKRVRHDSPQPGPSSRPDYVSDNTESGDEDEIQCLGEVTGAGATGFEITQYIPLDPALERWMKLNQAIRVQHPEYLRILAHIEEHQVILSTMGILLNPCLGISRCQFSINGADLATEYENDLQYLRTHLRHLKRLLQVVTTNLPRIPGEKEQLVQALNEANVRRMEQWQENQANHGVDLNQSGDRELPVPDEVVNVDEVDEDTIPGLTGGSDEDSMAVPDSAEGNE